jgi:hypothetical protein
MFVMTDAVGFGLVRLASLFMLATMPEPQKASIIVI